MKTVLLIEMSIDQWKNFQVFGIILNIIQDTKLDSVQMPAVIQ